MAPIDSGARVSATATNATSAVSTLTGIAGQSIFVTDISGSSDKAGALILLKDGSTTIWQDRVSNTAAYTKEFRTPIRITLGASCTVTVDGTAIANSNVAGFQL